MYLRREGRQGIRVLHVDDLNVDPGSRGRGLAQQLLALAGDLARRERRPFLKLAVTVANTPAATLYFPEFTQICRDPNLPSALAIRRRFPTPAALAAASVEDLRTTRVGTHPSDERLADLRLLAATSIGVRSEDRVRGLVSEQDQLLDELALLTQHLERLESEMTLVVGQCREGPILTSIPGIGAVPAAAIIASIGNIANFARSSQLKSYFGWAPTLSQSGRSAGAARLSPRGSRLMKRTMYLAAWKAIQVEDSEWKRLYEKLIPLKCRYGERLGRRAGRSPMQPPSTLICIVSTARASIRLPLHPSARLA
jgi:hypothetical protein